MQTRQGDGAIRWLATLATATILSTPMPQHWHAPPWWLQQAVCIHQHEGAWNDNTGNSYFGGMQFLESTWRRAGGGHYSAFDHPGDRRYPFTAPIREQLFRAWTIWKKDNGSWREWGTTRYCGLH